MSFTEQERAILRAVQGDLPDTTTPYADIAARAGVREDEVLALLERLRDDGTIRRFGASIKHQRSGWNANVMVVWQAAEHEVDACGRAAAEHERVSHCYYRPSPAADWPYTLYTMVHGRSHEECLQVIEDLKAQGLPASHALLESLRELKKISMTYF